MGAQRRGKWFTEFGAGPSEYGAQLDAWFNHKLKLSQRTHGAPDDVAPFSLSKFVLTHQDLSPRNLILDGSGTVWVIDWAFAGAYPPVPGKGNFDEAITFSGLQCTGSGGDRGLSDGDHSSVPYQLRDFRGVGCLAVIRSVSVVQVNIRESGVSGGGWEAGHGYSLVTCTVRLLCR